MSDPRPLDVRDLPTLPTDQPARLGQALEKTSRLGRVSFDPLVGVIFVPEGSESPAIVGPGLPSARVELTREEAIERLRAIRYVAQPGEPMAVEEGCQQMALADSRWVSFYEPAQSSKDATGYEVEVRIPAGGFTPPTAPAQPSVAYFDGSEVAARMSVGDWFDRVTVQIGEPGKEEPGKEYQSNRRNIEGFNVTHASVNQDGSIGLGGYVSRSGEPAQPSLPADPPEDITTATPAPERLLGWLPEGWRVHKQVNHFYGPNGEQVFNHGHGHVVAWGSKHEGIEAWTEWTEQDKQALVLALAHPERVLSTGVTEDYAKLRARAESFLLADDATDLTSYDLGAHEAALAILRWDGSGPDPRVTMRGEIEQGRVAVAGLMELLGQRVVADGERSIAQLSACAYLSQAIEGNPAALNFLEDGWTWLDDKGEPRSYVATVQRIEGQTPGQMISELKAQNARLKAILDAETGRKGLPGWTWGGWVDRVWQYRWSMALARVQPAVDDLNPAKAFVYLGALGIEIEGVTDALDGMEKATAWARARGYTAETPDLDPTTADQIRALWDAGDDIGAVGRYRYLFTPPMDVSDALRAVRKVVDAPVETAEGRKSFFSRYESMIQAERDAVDTRLLALSNEEIPE